MKRLNLIIHIVVIVAVAALFVFEFTSWGPQAPTAEKDSAQAQGEQPETASMQGDLRVAYVNIDTLLAGYQMYQDKRDEFAQEQSSTQAELKSRSQELKEKFQDLREKLNKGLITRAKAKMMQQDLGQQEQKLYQLRSQMSSKLAEKEQVIYRQVLNSVMDYLDDYADKHNYHFILSYSFGGPILYKEKKLNITSTVLKGLNQQYNKKESNNQ